MKTKAHIIDERQLDDRRSDDHRVVTGPSRIKLTSDPVSDGNMACEYLIVNSRQARMPAFLLCAAADKLEAQ